MPTSTKHRWNRPMQTGQTVFSSTKEDTVGAEGPWITGTAKNFSSFVAFIAEFIRKIKSKINTIQHKIYHTVA